MKNETFLNLCLVKVFRCIINAVDKCAAERLTGQSLLTILKECSEKCFGTTASMDLKLQSNWNRAKSEVRAGILTKLNSGNWPFSLPAEYSRHRSSKGNYRVSPNEKSLFVIASFYWMNFENISMTEIASRLGEYGYPISAWRVSNMLRNPLYAGILAHRGQQYKSSFRPIVSKEIFEDVQNKIIKRTHRRVEFKDRRFPLNGIVRVLGHEDDCFIGYVREKITGTTFHYYKNERRRSGFAINMTREELHSRFSKFYHEHTVASEEKLRLSLKKIHRENVTFIQGMRDQMEQEVVLSNSLLNEWSFSDVKLPTRSMQMLKSGVDNAESQIAAWEKFTDESFFVECGVRIVSGLNWLDVDYDLMKELPKIWFRNGVLFDPHTKRISSKYISSVFLS